MPITRPRISAGTVSCWGYNASGELGHGTSGGFRRTPVSVVGLTGAVAADAGANDTCVRLADGGARCWGDNGTGELGDGTTSPSSVPAAVLGVP